MYRASAFAILFLAAARLASAGEVPAAAPSSNSEHIGPVHSPAKSPAAAAEAPVHTQAKSPAAGPAPGPANAPSSAAFAPSIASAPTIASARMVAPSPTSASAPAIASSPAIAYTPESSHAMAPSPDIDEFDEDILYATESPIPDSPPAPSVEDAPAEDDLSSTTTGTGGARSQIDTIVTFGALATAIVAVFA